jgi:hypothetical protein
MMRSGSKKEKEKEFPRKPKVYRHQTKVENTYQAVRE